MAKIIIWIVIVFVVLFGLRLLNLASSKRRAGLAAKSGKTQPPANQMVRCEGCGVFLPQAEATRVANGFVCGDAKCIAHR